MAVYVDDMNANYGRMIMCHMFADSTEELLAIARTIGVQAKWIQKQGTIREHFDICLANREKALKAGAKAIEYPGDVKILIDARRKALASG